MKYAQEEGISPFNEFKMVVLMASHFLLYIVPGVENTSAKDVGGLHLCFM